jgi:hypothetical protein
VDSTFTITLKDFHVGYAPVAHLNPLTEIGQAGHASAMANVDVLTPGLLTQGPALANLTAGTQAGAITELLTFLMDKAVSSDATYGIGPTKLQKISSTAVTNTGSWPHTVTNMAEGESVIDLRGNLYYLFNKASAGDIGKYDLNVTFDDDWGSTVPTGFAALQKAPHPVAAKEDIMAFGNGRYGGIYIDSLTTLYPTKLDFGSGNEVADVCFHANTWLWAVNSGVSGTNRNSCQIYFSDPAGLSAILLDETTPGPYRIGFLYPLGGVVYVAYQDLSSAGGYAIGYIAGRQIKPLRYFTGSLPTFEQKTLYKDTILFLSSGSVWSMGAPVEQLPLGISQLADGGYATVGAIAAPFGTPMVASTDGTTNFRLAKFSGYDTACTWRWLIRPAVSGRQLGYIDEVVVLTKTLGANARCDLILETDQATGTSSTMQIKTTGKRRHVFKDADIGLGGVEDFRVFLNWANGSAVNDCAIREIFIAGHFKEA